ncbi:hypothetical protein BHM03_00039674, partial [Ensete ventricosum]
RRKSLQGAAGHGHGQSLAGRPVVARSPARGGRLRQGPLQRGGRLRLGPTRKGAAPARGQSAGAAARGWPAAARRPQGAVAPMVTPQGLLPTVCRWSPAANPQGAVDFVFGARRKAVYGQRHRPWRCRSQGWLPLGRVATGGQRQLPPA